MIEYIYFVKCDGCDDEPFYFFDEAKECAIGCLKQKPVITQVEVNRNDFGECVDSCDLGTVWSWEDISKETNAEPTASIFTKDDLKHIADGQDPEFDSLDNSVDYKSEIDQISVLDEVPDNFSKPLTEASEHDLSALVADSINHLVNGLGKDPWSEDFADEVAHDLENNYDIEAVDDPLNYNHWFDAVAGEVSRQVNRDYRKDTLEENFGVYFKKKEDWDEFKKLCDEIGLYTIGDVDIFMKDFEATPENILAKLRDYRAELGPDFKIKESANRAGGFRTDGYRTALACYDSDDFDINVEFGMQDPEEYEVEDQVYLLCPGQTVADLVVYLSRECGFTSVYVYGETSALRSEIKTAARFKTVPGNHDYRHYGIIDDRLVEAPCERKPIPEDMTIEQLIEEMEENEDMVECTWCNDLFDKDQCRYEVNLGWLCSRCEAAIKSRGETLTFRENNYWDFLDEELAGADNAVVDCKVADVIAHSEDEKPVDCEGKKKPLEKPLTEVKSYLEELEEAIDYRARLTDCPECGAEQSFDQETGICINCGFTL